MWFPLTAETPIKYPNLTSILPTTHERPMDTTFQEWCENCVVGKI